MKKKDSTVSRRSFVRDSLVMTGTAIAAAGPLIWTGCSQSGERGSETSGSVTPGLYAPFKVGFQSQSLRHLDSLEDIIREAGKLNLGYVELWRGHLSPSVSRGQIQRTKRRLAEAGLAVNAFGVEDLTSDETETQVLFEFGRALGVTTLNIYPTRDAVAGLQNWVSLYNVRVAIHNRGPEDDRWAMPEWIFKAVENLDPRVGACADLGHFIRSGVDPVKAIEMLGTRVLGVHFRDFDKQGNEVVVGRGQLDVQAALVALKKTGFDGPFSLEFGGQPRDPVPGMLESLSAIRDALQRI